MVKVPKQRENITTDTICLLLWGVGKFKKSQYMTCGKGNNSET